jgi:hypothetical protein
MLLNNLVSAKPAARSGAQFGHSHGHVFMSLVKCSVKLVVKWSTNYALASGTVRDK